VLLLGTYVSLVWGLMCGCFNVCVLAWTYMSISWTCVELLWLTCLSPDLCIDCFNLCVAAFIYLFLLGLMFLLLGLMRSCFGLCVFDWTHVSIAWTYV